MACNDSVVATVGHIPVFRCGWKWGRIALLGESEPKGILICSIAVGLDMGVGRGPLAGVVA